MNPILNKGYMSAGPWPCRERQFRVWKIELRTNKELLPAIEYAQKTKRVPEELGEYFLWITRSFARHHSYDKYTNYEDYVSYVVLFLCRYVKNFNSHKSTEPNRYFLNIISVYFHRAVEGDLKQLDIIDKVKEEMDLLDLDHYYELYDCAW